MKILNIHGYHGSPENSAYAALKPLGHNVIAPCFDYDNESPDEVMSSLRKIAEEFQPDFIVGTSLGGFFGLALAVETGCRAALVNPCLMPFYTLSELGYEGDMSQYVRIFGTFADMDISKIFAVIGEKDEVISYHSFTKAMIPNCKTAPEGMHSGATMPIAEFFAEVLK